MQLGVVRIVEVVAGQYFSLRQVQQPLLVFSGKADGCQPFRVLTGFHTLYFEYSLQHNSRDACLASNVPSNYFRVFFGGAYIQEPSVGAEANRRYLREHRKLAGVDFYELLLDAIALLVQQHEVAAGKANESIVEVAEDVVALEVSISTDDAPQLHSRFGLVTAVLIGDRLENAFSLGQHRQLRVKCLLCTWFFKQIVWHFHIGVIKIPSFTLFLNRPLHYGATGSDCKQF